MGLRLPRYKETVLYLRQAPMRILDATSRVAHTFKVATQTKCAAGVCEGRGLPCHLRGHIRVQT